MAKRMAFWLLLAVAWPSCAADLLGLYHAGLRHDSVLAEARSKLLSAREKINQSQALLRPSIALSAYVNRNREEVDNRKSGAHNEWDYNSQGYVVSLTQPLYRQQYWLGLQQSKAVVMQAEATFANEKQNLILRTAQAYFDVLQAQDRWEAAMALQSSVAAQLGVAKEAFKFGTGIKTDIFDAEARLQFAAAEVMAAQAELDVRQSLLESITGEKPRRLPPLGKRLSLDSPRPLDLDLWLEAADQSNLGVQQQRIAVDIASQEVDRLRAGHYPTLDLVASAGRKSGLTSGAREVTSDYKIGLQLNVPLYQGGGTESKVSEALANRDAALSSLETARRSAKTQVRQSHTNVVSGLSRIRSLEAAYEAAQQAITSNKDAFEAGVRLNIDVLNAQNQAFNARVELTRAIAETLLAQLKLKAAVGSLGEEDVALMNKLLETNK